MKYFKLENGTHHGDPRSAYLFILALEVVFAVIKSNQNTNKLRIFEHGFLHTAYANDNTFFVKNQISVIEILKVLDNFSKISGLKLNMSGTLQHAMQCINLNKETVKILGIHFSYNKKLEE